MEEEAEDKKNNEEKKGDDPMYFSDDLVSDDLVSDDDKFTRNSRTELDYFFAESFKVFSEKKWYQKQQL
jgi:hypothetical protein